MRATCGLPIGLRWLRRAALLAAALLAACGPEAETAPPEARPVRTVTVVKRETGETVAFTGRIEAENETRLAFRIGGRMIERLANVGDRIEPDQVVAKLDPQDELNALRAAQAAVAAAQAQLAEAKSEFERQRFLLARNVNSRAQFERAEQAMETARAQLETAEAQSRLAEDQVARTELRVDSAGVVTTAPVEAGEVVQAGQMIIRVARQDGRDAVFDVPAQVLRSAPADPLIRVTKTDDPALKAT
jgi:RND family efflux transporter MFP subunit